MRAILLAVIGAALAGCVTTGPDVSVEGPWKAFNEFCSDDFSSSLNSQATIDDRARRRGLRQITSKSERRRRVIEPRFTAWEYYDGINAFLLLTEKEKCGVRIYGDAPAIHELVESNFSERLGEVDLSEGDLRGGVEIFRNPGGPIILVGSVTIDGQTRTMLTAMSVNDYYRERLRMRELPAL